MRSHDKVAKRVRDKVLRGVEFVEHALFEGARRCRIRTIYVGEGPGEDRPLLYVVGGVKVVEVDDDPGDGVWGGVLSPEPVLVFLIEEEVGVAEVLVVSNPGRVPARRAPIGLPVLRTLLVAGHEAELQSAQFAVHHDSEESLMLSAETDKLSPRETERGVPR